MQDERRNLFSRDAESSERSAAYRQPPLHRPIREPKTQNPLHGWGNQDAVLIRLISR
jgi:hypothetical protein